MAAPRRRARLVIALAAALALVAGALSTGSGGAGAEPGQGFERATAAKQRHVDALMGRAGVVGVGVGATGDGAPAVVVLTEGPGVRGIPAVLDGVPVVVKVTGPLVALHHRPGHDGGPPDRGDDDDDGNGDGGQLAPTDRWDRPVPIGISTGNWDECSAGTIGGRLVDDRGDVYVLSNNHVYSPNNSLADIGVRVLQPGRYDTGCARSEDDVLGTVAAVVPISFSEPNRVDAAIAATTTDRLDTSTPSDGYGSPSSEAAEAALSMAVLKYGRTTGQTSAVITAVGATVRIGYSDGTATFEDQIVFEGRRVVRAGDSGSLLVEESGLHPLGLVFAGSRNSHLGVANPIGHVLAELAAQLGADRTLRIDGP